MNVQGNVALMTVVRLDTGNVGSFRVTDNGPGALDLVECNFGPGCPDAQAFYFDLGLFSGDFVVVDAPPLPTTNRALAWSPWQALAHERLHLSRLQAPAPGAR